MEFCVALCRRFFDCQQQFRRKARWMGAVDKEMELSRDVATKAKLLLAVISFKRRFSTVGRWVCRWSFRRASADSGAVGDIKLVEL